MNNLLVLLQAAPAADGGMAPYSSIIMMVLIIAIFYFFMIRPQSKRQKELNKFRASMKAGDQVITAGGVYGKIKEVGEGFVMLEIADKVVIKINTSSIFASISQQEGK